MSARVNLFKPDTVLVAAIEPSPNLEPRVGRARADMIILHYTGMVSCEAAICWLAAPEARVSAHYVIDAAGRITQMVPESMRAWHAGVSFWAGETDVNSRSIGIEIHNPGHDLGYPDFPEAQMAAVEALCVDIMARHGIRPERFLAHSDVAPARKRDPGEKFDWARLARAGIGHWVAPEPLGSDAGLRLGDDGEEVRSLQEKLTAYGYGISVTGCYDSATEIVVTAFQRHFRPAKVDGRADGSTIITLERLLESRAKI